MKVKFREIANFVAGQSPKSEYYSESDGVPFLQGNRTFGTFHPTIDTYTTKTTKIANKGDILMSVRAPVGDLNFAPVDLCIGRGLAAITAKDGDNAFLFYALKYNINNLLKQSNGTTYDSVTGDIVKEMDMIIPEDKSVCRKISKLLYTIDSKIENNKQTMAELESMAKTIYDYWFLQYEFPNESGKSFKSSGGKMVYNEKIKREIPEGWKIGKCKDIVEVITGKEDANFSSPNGKYKFFTCSQDISLCDIPKFKGSAVLIAGNGDFNVKHYTGEFNAYQRTYVLIPNEIKYYGLLYISALYKVKSFHKGSNGSIVKFITKGDIEDIELIMPNNNKLLDKLNQYIFTIEKIKEENEELTKLRDELLPLLMNGQVSFKN